jgi:branched-chain amino acid transport system substrate-binding protein
VFEDGVAIIRSFQKVGFSPKVLFETSAPSNSDQFSNGIGAANTEGIFYAVSWSPDADTPQNKEFVGRYQKKFGGLPAEDAADAFATAQVLQAAVEAVGSLDQDKIRDYLHSHTVDTVEGKLSWDQTGAPKGDFLLAQWQSGKSEVVAPEELATSQNIVFPKPNWSS